MLELVRPEKAHASAVMAFRREMLAMGSAFDGCAGLEDTESYAEWLDFETRLRRQYGDGYTPSDVFLAMEGEEAVGIIDYRHPLTPFLASYGGNIGYSVRPSRRRQGIATRMLTLLLPHCRSCGEEKLLLCCDPANEASRKTILRCGGMLESTVPDEPGLGQSGLIERYIIPLNV